MQQDHEFELEEDEKVTGEEFTQCRLIDLGSYSGDERKITVLGIVANGPIDLGSNSGDETKFSIDILPKMQRTSNVS